MTLLSDSSTPANAHSTNPAGVTPGSHTVFTPLGLDAARITGGLWAERQVPNRDVSIPDGLRQLHDAKNLNNFDILAGKAEGEAAGPIFADSDVYKWLEAAAWEYGREPNQKLLDDQLAVTAIVASAQEEDGYLDTMVALTKHERYTNFARDHEHYCAGHMFQAAVAQSRATGHDDLLKVAIRLADHLVRTFGPDKRHDVDGHPVVEMGLVELYRETGNTDYLDLAKYFVDARGYGLLTQSGGDRTYLSDRVPVREASTVEGHAVRAVYFTAGAADVAIETGDTELLDALGRVYDDMVATKQYVNGGLGSRWDLEAFGDPYELPADRAYAETCAAIGGAQWAWRMLLATGDVAYADQIELMLYNGMLPGVSLAGGEFFYVNTMHLREGFHPDDERSPGNGRRAWFNVACCPPNVMRTLASLATWLTTETADGLQFHQYAPSEVTGAGFTVRVETEYPWQGTVRLTVVEAPTGEASLTVRVPGWASGATLDGAPVQPGYATTRRTFAAGDTLELVLPIEARIVTADPRVDDARGQVAIERGPLLYAFEALDQPEGVILDDVSISATPQITEHTEPDLLGGVVTLSLPGHQRGRGETADSDVTLTAIPYYAWANRTPHPMRVWLPVA